MADNCSIAAAQAAILAKLESVNVSAQALSDATFDSYQLAAADAAVLVNIVNWYAGGWVPTLCGDLPSLGEIIGRIANFGAGWSQWSYKEYETDAARTEIHLPYAVTGPHRLTLCAAYLGPGDYTIVGDLLTLAYPLLPGYRLTLTRYGAPS